MNMKSFHNRFARVGIALIVAGSLHSAEAGSDKEEKNIALTPIGTYATDVFNGQGLWPEMGLHRPRARRRGDGV